MKELDVWCGQTGIWTQLSFHHIIREGGFIDVSGLTADDKDSVLRSLQSHASRNESWQPTSFLADTQEIRLGSSPPESNKLTWTTVSDCLVQSVPSNLEKSPVKHTKCFTQFSLN